MAKFIEVSSQAVAAMLIQAQDKFNDLSPVLQAIGDDIIERTKQRFASATAPDGTPWVPNTEATLINYIRQRGGFSDKTGKITKKGQQLAISKRPLQGESGDLAQQFNKLVVSGDTLLVGSTMEYAAMQQFGGTKAQFPNLWGDIPARPFLPIMADGSLYPDEESRIVDTIRQYLS